MAFEPHLIKLLIVETSEVRRQSPRAPDKSKLGNDGVDDETEPSLSGKLETILGFALGLIERISHRQQVRVQYVAAVRREIEVADLVPNLERATHQIAARADMFRPWHDETCEAHISRGLEPLQSAFDQFIAQPAESKALLVIAEARSGDDSEPYVAKARTVAITMLETEVNDG